MPRTRRVTTVKVLTAALCCAVTALAQPPRVTGQGSRPRYRAIDIGGVHASSEAKKINAAGDVVCDGYPNGFVRMADGTVVEISTRLPNTRFANSYALNDKGEVVGRSHGEITRAVLWRDGRIRDLGLLPGGRYSAAVDVNNKGQVVGRADAPRGSGAFIWDAAGGMRDLGGLPQHDRLEPHAINDQGDVVGMALGSSGGDFPMPMNHAVQWRNGKLRDLTPDGYAFSEAWDINERGQIAGSAQRERQASRAFVWNPDGSQRELGAPPDVGTTALDVGTTALGLNNQGDVVGRNMSRGERRAALWRDGVFYDLNDLVTSVPGWMFYEARAINDSGAIAASAQNANGTHRAFLLTPIAP